MEAGLLLVLSESNKKFSIPFPKKKERKKKRNQHTETTYSSDKQNKK